MKSSKFSLLRKIMLSTIPLLAGITVSVTSVFTLNGKKDSETVHAMELVDLSSGLEVSMLKSSQAIHAYVIDPANTVSLERLKGARESFDAQTRQLQPLTDGHKSLQALLQKMTATEAEDLRRLENEVVALTTNHNSKAGEVFFKSYLPARSAQGDNFVELHKLVEARSAEILETAQSERLHHAFWSALTLVGCTIFGLAVMYWVILSTIRTIRGISTALNDSSGALRRAAEEVSSSSSSLSQSSSEQAASLEETAASIEEMSSMITKNSQNAKSTASFTTLSQSKAQEGQDAVTRMMHSMEDISQSNQSIMEQINESNRQMSEIVNVIQQIGTKTKVINDIVFQTKLLSFNASVEAARAGEHGKGFAVVAEEVGNLAQMSGNAAKEISEMLQGSIQKVEAIVSETKVKVESLVSQGKVKVEAGVAVARQCGELLTDIVENVSNVSSMAGEISGASQEQSQGVTEINKAIGQLDQVTQQNAATSEQTARAAEELSAQSAALRNSIKQLVGTIEGGGHSVPAMAAKPVAPAAKNTPPSNVVPLKPKAKNASVALKPEMQKVAGGGGVPDRDHDGFQDV